MISRVFVVLFFLLVVVGQVPAVARGGGSSGSRTVSVNGYTRKDGTVVPAHVRSAPGSKSKSGGGNTAPTSTYSGAGSVSYSNDEQPYTPTVSTAVVPPSKALVDDFAAYQRDIVGPNSADQEGARVALADLDKQRQNRALTWPELATTYDTKVIPRYRAIVARLDTAKPATPQIQELNKRLRAAFGAVLAAADRCHETCKSGNAEGWQSSSKEYASVSFEEALRLYNYLAEECRPAEPTAAASPSGLQPGVHGESQPSVQSAR